MFRWAEPILRNYDPIGNRESATDWDGAAEAQRTTAYTPNSLNQYASLTVGTGSPVPFTYDLDGNLATLEGREYTYDGENRLVEYAPAAPAEGDKKLAFLYDYMGRRVKRETYAYVSGQWTKTEERRYVYDGWNLAQELDGANGLVRSYVWGLDLSQTLQGAGGVGGLLASVEGTDVYHYCFDTNGNVGQLVKASDGTVAAHYEYDPFGNTTWKCGPQADANPFRFSTKYNDTVSGLYYYGYRYYAPAIGRWVNRDPIGEEGGLNLFIFVNNASTDKFDLIGLLSPSATVDEIEAEVRSLIADGRKYGYNLAASMLENYLLGGGDKILSSSWLRSFGLIVAAERKNQIRFENELGAIALSMADGETKAYTSYWDALITYYGRGFSFEELFWVSGDSTLTSTGDFSLVKKDCKVEISGIVRHEWNDDYNWNPGFAVLIPGHGYIPDSALDQLSIRGARGFHMSSEWQQKLSGSLEYFLWIIPVANFSWTDL